MNSIPFCIAFIIGSCISSFLYCLVYRKTHNLSKNIKRSICDTCGHQLGIIDLIPVIGYLLRKGHCKYCKTKINCLYIISELIGGFILTMIVYKYRLSIYSLKYFILFVILSLISFYDIETMEIPDSCVVFGIINICVFSRSFKQFLLSLLNGIVIGLCLVIIAFIMKTIKNKEMIGGGDIKLLFMLSMYTSIQKSLYSITLACFMGLIYILLSKKQKDYIAFGPFLSLGYMLMLIV